MVAIFIWVITVGVYIGLVKDNTDRTVDALLGVALLGWFPIIVLVYTPRKMWIKAQDKIAEYEDRFKPRLAIKLDDRSVAHKADEEGQYESWLRLQIANESDEGLQGIVVRIEDYKPDAGIPIPFRLSDAYCEQPPSSIAARDRMYVELIRSAGKSLHLRSYARSDVSIPRNEYIFTVRASTTSFPCDDQKTIMVSVADDGKLSCRFLE